jgi:hypothetical protein
MNDNALIQIFLPIINAGLIADGFTGVTVKQANQPTMQGIDTAPSIYFYKLNNKRYGFLGREDVWNGSQMVHTESQYIESTWIFQALVLQKPTTPNQYTASDLVNEAAAILQSDNTNAVLNSNGIGILRVTDISNAYFFDDRDNFEASPSFNLTFVYENSRTNLDPKVTDFTHGIYGI